MDRRGFLSSILVASAAPAIVRADSLMRIVPRDIVTLGVPMTATEINVAWDEWSGRMAYRACNPPLIVEQSFDGVTWHRMLMPDATLTAHAMGRSLIRLGRVDTMCPRIVE